MNPEAHQSPDGCDFSKFVARFKPERLDINCDNIHEVKIGKLLGSGSARVVYEGEWNGQSVALKKSHGTGRIKKIVQEAAVLYSLRRSRNTIHILGWCNKTIVLPKLDILDNQISKDPIKRALQKSLEFAKGVQQMHTIDVTHGDLKWS